MMAYHFFEKNTHFLIYLENESLFMKREPGILLFRSGLFKFIND